MSLQMSQDTAGMLVILEDTKEGIRKALGRDEEFARKFTEKSIYRSFPLMNW